MKVSLVMRTLREMRERGEIDGNVSTRTMARVSQQIGQPVAEISFRRIEEDALTKIRLAILALARSQKQPD